MTIAHIVRSEQQGAHGQVALMPDGLMHTYDFPSSIGEVLVRSFSARLGGIPAAPTLESEALGLEPAFTNGVEKGVESLEKKMITLGDAPQSEWIILFVVVCTLVTLDAIISKKVAHNHKTHIITLTTWVLVALSYNILFFVRSGTADGIDWFIGYVLEWMLSVDNLFAFQLILKTYRAPTPIQDKALFYGILGSIVTRFVMFTAMGSALRSIHYIQFAFGFILIYGGIKALRDEDDVPDETDIPLVNLLKRLLGTRLKESYDLENYQLFIWDPDDGRLCATLLVPLIFCVIVADVVFAVDSVSAKVAQIPNQYIAYSSSVLALLGMRAMFFVLDDLVNYFELLKYGVACILIFIGVELMAAGKFQLPEWIVLLGIVTVFNVCIVSSLLLRNFSGKSRATTTTGAVEEEEETLLGNTSPSEDTAEGGHEGSDVTTSADEADEATETTATAAETDASKIRKKMQARFDTIESSSNLPDGTPSPLQPEAVPAPSEQQAQEKEKAPMICPGDSAAGG